jgi:hypothetical protein
LFGPCQDGGKSAVISMNIPKRLFAPLDKDGNYVAEFGEPVKAVWLTSNRIASQKSVNSRKTMMEF